jgi:hypothetical protein
VDHVLQFVIEAACLTGLVLLAAVVSRPLFGGKRWDRRMWIRSAGVLVVGLGYLFVNPRGARDLLPVVLGSTVFVVALVALLIAITMAWRFIHRERRSELDQKAAADFGAMGLFGLAAAACFVGAVFCTVALVQALGDESAYKGAPTCSTSPGPSCRSQADGRVIRKWAESSKGPHWLEISVAGRNETVQVETAYNVWDILSPGQSVTVTFWKEHVTEVGLPGGEAMQTVDSPNFALIPPIAFLAASVFGLLMFTLTGLVYRLKWQAALRGIDTSEIAA